MRSLQLRATRPRSRVMGIAVITLVRKIANFLSHPSNDSMFLIGSATVKIQLSVDGGRNEQC